MGEGKRGQEAPSVGTAALTFESKEESNEK